MAPWALCRNILAGHLGGEKDNEINEGSHAGDESNRRSCMLGQVWQRKVL